MLIKIINLKNKYKLNISGILHIGAHECEEIKQYSSIGISNKNTYWVEAMQNKVDIMKKKYKDDIHIYQGVIDNVDGKEITFHITDNGQSSSILEFGTHAIHHSYVKVIKTEQMKTIRMDTLIEKHSIPIQNINFLNLDIQGVELRALKSMEKHLKDIQYIYTEVNTEEVYKGCDLLHQLDQYLIKYRFKRVETKMFQKCGWGDAFYIKY